MAAQGALALCLILVVLLILARRARSGHTGDDREEMRALIGKAIEAHIEALAQSWLEARCDEGTARPGSDRFSQEVELFIGQVLRRSAEWAPPLRGALREFLVLERGAVRAEVERRVEAHLRRPLAGPPAQARAPVRI